LVRQIKAAQEVRKKENLLGLSKKGKFKESNGELMIR